MAVAADSGHGPIQPPLEAPRPRGRHPLAMFVGRRVAAGLATLLVASLLIFAAVNALPGDVATAVLGRNATPATIAAVRSELHLNQPLLVRYASWLGGIVHGDFGDSAVEFAQSQVRQPVLSLIGTPLRNSLILAALTIVLLVPVSLLLGVLAGVHAMRSADYAISMSTLLLGAFPEFVVATLLIFLFFTELHLLPPVALVSPGESPLSAPTALILPIMTLLAVCISFSARQIRAGMIEVLGKDYVGMARINGVPEPRVLRRYALRNALAPSVQIFAQTIQYLLGGIIIVESVFAYPGIGTFLVNAVSARDVTEVAAVAMILAALYISINIAADVVVVFLVPKLRTGVR